MGVLAVNFCWWYITPKSHCGHKSIRPNQIHYPIIWEIISPCAEWIIWGFSEHILTLYIIRSKLVLFSPETFRLQNHPSHSNQLACPTISPVHVQTRPIFSCIQNNSSLPTSFKYVISQYYWNKIISFLPISYINIFCIVPCDINIVKLWQLVKMIYNVIKNQVLLEFWVLSILNLIRHSLIIVQLQSSFDF